MSTDKKIPFIGFRPISPESQSDTEYDANAVYRNAYTQMHGAESFTPIHAAPPTPLPELKDFSHGCYDASIVAPSEDKDDELNLSDDDLHSAHSDDFASPFSPLPMTEGQLIPMSRLTPSPTPEETVSPNLALTTQALHSLPSVPRLTSGSESSSPASPSQISSATFEARVSPVRVSPARSESASPSHA